MEIVYESSLLQTYTVMSDSFIKGLNKRCFGVIINITIY